MGNYGIPYMGSKNTIAHIIIDVLPKADNFYDLFYGGCSITHVAMLSKKYKHIIFNDIDKDLPQLFLDSIHGKYKKEKRWISKEDFEKEKDNSAYIRCVWSFGNKGTNYLYGKEIEPYKKAYWYAVMFNDYSLFWNLGINIPKCNATTYKDRRLKVKQLLTKEVAKIRKQLKLRKNYIDLQYENNQSLERLERLQSLERLERLQSLQSLESLERLQSLEMFTKSYDQVPIKENSIVYCDIPYENTAEYVNSGFYHKKFYDWACNQKELVVISSYNISDDRFQRVVNLKKAGTLNGGSTGKNLNEGLFIPKHQKELWDKMRYSNEQ